MLCGGIIVRRSGLVNETNKAGWRRLGCGAVCLVGSDLVDAVSAPRERVVLRDLSLPRP